MHKLRFVAVEEFEEDTPDFSFILGAFAVRRCKAAVVSGDVRHRVPLCAEDAGATDDSSVFDEDGYLVGAFDNFVLVDDIVGAECGVVVGKATSANRCGNWSD